MSSESAQARSFSRPVIVAGYVVFAAVLWLLVDTAMYFAFSWLNTKRNLFYDSRDITQEELRRFLDMGYFHPTVGWTTARIERNNLGTRRAEDYPLKPSYKIQAFGDSFTYGGEVEPSESYCAFIERSKQWDCLNYGVNGYGPDQSLLRYAASPIRSEFAILGILCENIGRVVSRNPTYYMRWKLPPKPRFVSDGAGRFRLLEAPFRSEEEAQRMLDGAFMDSLKAEDYWPSYYERVQHAPPRLEWPATWMVLKHFDFFAQRVAIEVKRRVSPTYEVEKQTYKYYHLYDSRTEALEIFQFTIDEFVRTARQRGEIPLIVVFSDEFSLDMIRKYGTNPYAPLMDFVRQRGYDHVDVGAIFLKEGYGDLFVARNAHYSPKGNARVAHAVVELIESVSKRAPGTPAARAP
jgi:hypothetical protein